MKSNVLLSIDVPIVSSEICARVLEVDDTKLCASGETGKDSCLGDLGGPLVVSRDGSDVLIGVMSWGAGCERPGSPGVYARIPVALDWIDEIVNEEPTSIPHQLQHWYSIQSQRTGAFCKRRFCV